MVRVLFSIGGGSCPYAIKGITRELWSGFSLPASSIISCKHPACAAVDSELLSKTAGANNNNLSISFRNNLSSILITFVEHRNVLEFLLQYFNCSKHWSYFVPMSWSSMKTFNSSSVCLRLKQAFRNCCKSLVLSWLVFTVGNNFVISESRDFEFSSFFLWYSSLISSSCFFQFHLWNPGFSVCFPFFQIQFKFVV